LPVHHAPSQNPVPGTTILKIRGDIQTFQLQSEVRGQAFLRTNIGHAALIQREIIAEVEQGTQKMGTDWFDIPMEPDGKGRYQIHLPLLETGHFQAKAFLIPEGGGPLLWPSGGNISINVESEYYAEGNGIYCAFVRQFGPNRSREKTWSLPEDNTEHCARSLEELNYATIPPSGTFRDLIEHLDHIFTSLGCKILHLLPVHPIPTTYGRMGRFGSPYAALDFFGIDPGLARFDPRKTPLDQFRELVDGVHLRGGRIFIDIALNHTGWAAKLHETHPEWIRKDFNGRFHSPGAWGITWDDLTELEHHHKELWYYLADVLLTWCERGVDGFRCDAGYMIPREAWSFLVAKVRERFPHTVFLLEGLGGDPKITDTLLNESNLNWAYSELFQNYSRDQIARYMNHAWKRSNELGFMAHYAETHDNDRLASKSKSYARMRVALSALLSRSGTFGFTNGVEWFATEKIDVHRDSGLNWGAGENLLNWIRSLNRLLLEHPCLKRNSSLKFLEGYPPEILAFQRIAHDGGEQLTCFFNLNDRTEISLDIQRHGTPLLLPDFEGSAVEKHTGTFLFPPHGFLFLGHTVMADDTAELLQRAIALEVASWFHTLPELGRKNTHLLTSEFYRNPLNYCENLGIVDLWCTGHDEHRDFVLLDGHMLLIQSAHRFKADFRGETRESVQAGGSLWYTVFPPKPHPESVEKIPPHPSKMDQLTLEVMQHNHVQRVKARILSISGVSPELSGEEPNTGDLIFLDTNGRGGMLRASAKWAQLNSRYDALLAANLHPNCPVDRHIFLRRWRAWSRFRGHSMEFSTFNTEKVRLGDAISYTFKLPQGTGKWARVEVRINMLHSLNIVQTTIHRASQNHRDMLADRDPVTFIFRPDIEDRNFHQVTKAFEGAEQQFPGRIADSAHNGFEFLSHTGTSFLMTTEKAHFQREPLWIYNHHYPLESSRGLEDHGDMFSPGYFSFDLTGGASCTILVGTKEDLARTEHRKGIQSTYGPDNASLNMKVIQKKPYPVMLESKSLKEDLLKAMNHFIVQRGTGKTVIAGYPWFLDWGRDTLISARGMITAGYIAEVEDMLLQFGLFAKSGTIPNMIQGEDASNRDTSDAPLWYILVCRELCEVRNNLDFLAKAVDDTRSVLDVMLEIARGYLAGTPNGITVEKETGLVYSPAHFTWMDTNYPAGTPREGYPVEIQALWFQALVFLFDVTDDTLWQKLAGQVKESFSKLFWMEERGYFADCIRIEKPQSAADGILEDALRPNQVLALLSGLADENQSRRALDAMMKLVVPGGLRSIADSEVRTPLPVRNREGHIINDPLNPFWPRYLGPEDSNRKPAYHNGTAWTWPFPMLCEAFAEIRGRKSDALNLLNSGMKYFYSGCIGHMPEILDGSSPHTPRGCDAQAWSVTEWYRVLNILDRTDPGP